MQRDALIRQLRRQQDSLHRQFGVTSLALFGSAARDDAGPDSDVDLLVEFDRPTGLFGLIRLQQHLEQLLACRVDLATLGSLRPHMRDEVLREAIRVA